MSTGATSECVAAPQPSPLPLRSLLCTSHFTGALSPTTTHCPDYMALNSHRNTPPPNNCCAVPEPAPKRLHHGSNRTAARVSTHSGPSLPTPVPLTIPLLMATRVSGARVTPCRSLPLHPTSKATPAAGVPLRRRLSSSKWLGESRQAAAVVGEAAVAAGLPPPRDLPAQSRQGADAGEDGGAEGAAGPLRPRLPPALSRQDGDAGVAALPSPTAAVAGGAVAGVGARGVAGVPEAASRHHSHLAPRRRCRRRTRAGMASS